MYVEPSDLASCLLHKLNSLASLTLLASSPTLKLILVSIAYVESFTTLVCLQASAIRLSQWLQLCQQHSADFEILLPLSR